MANINLLPWREERREQMRQEFFVLLGVVAGAALVVAAVFHIVLSSAISALARGDIANRTSGASLTFFTSRVRWAVEW